MTLGEIEVDILGYGCLPICRLPHGFTLTNPVFHGGERVRTFAAVNSKEGELIHNGDFVEIKDQRVRNVRCHTSMYSAQQVNEKYGRLMACFESGARSQNCIIQAIVEEKAMDQPILNEFDCPLLSLSTTFHVIPSSSTVTSVSIIHQCSQACTFAQSSTPVTREREVLISSQLTYTHDYSNTLFCLNMYAMQC